MAGFELNINNPYLYNDVEVVIDADNYFEMTLDKSGKAVINRIGENEKKRETKIFIPIIEKKEYSLNEIKTLSKIITIKIELLMNNGSRTFCVIPDVMYGNWKNYIKSTEDSNDSDTLVNHIFNYRKDTPNTIGIHSFGCNGNNNTKINIENIFAVIFSKSDVPEILYADTLNELFETTVLSPNSNKGKTEVFSYGCVGIIEISGQKYRKIIPDMSYFTWGGEISSINDWEEVNQNGPTSNWIAVNEHGQVSR